MRFWELHYRGTMKIVIFTLNIVKFTQIFPSVYVSHSSIYNYNITLFTINLVLVYKYYSANYNHLFSLNNLQYRHRTFLRSIFRWLGSKAKILIFSKKIARLGTRSLDLSVMRLWGRDTYHWAIQFRWKNKKFFCLYIHKDKLLNFNIKFLLLFF